MKTFTVDQKIPSMDASMYHDEDYPVDDYEELSERAKSVNTPNNLCIDSLKCLDDFKNKLLNAKIENI